VKNRKLIDEILKYADERGITIPADILLDISKQDAKALLDQLKVTVEIKPEDLPLFTRTQPGAVPASGTGGKILSSEGWIIPPPARVITVGGGSSGGITEAPIDGNAYSRKNAGWEVAAGSGDVTGPAGATADNFASFNGATGKIIKDSGLSSSDFEPADATILKSGDADWIDLTDGGATTLHSHAGAGLGDVVGPAGATGDNIAVYDGATGKLIKDGGVAISGLQTTLVVGNLTASSPLAFDETRSVIGGAAVVSIQPANTSDPGYLTAADWNTFNGKSDLSVGNLSSTAETLGGAAANGSSTDASRADHKHEITMFKGFTDSSHYTGFPNTSDTALSWDDGTYTLTLTASSDSIWESGVEYTIDTLTKALTVAQEAVSGIYWFWITAPGGVPQLNAGITKPGFDKCLVATVYWNTTTNKGILADERHWFGRDRYTHEYLHETVGTRFASGLAGTFTDTTFSIDTGGIFDEDLAITFAAPMTTCNVLYHNGDADWKWDAAATSVFKVVGGGDNNLRYNSGNNLATVSNNKYVNCWVFISNDVTSPVFSVIGTAEFNTIALARASNVPNLGSLISAESKLIYKVTYQNNGGTPDYIEATDYRSSSNLPVANYVATDHGSLAGLADDDHPQYHNDARGNALYSTLTSMSAANALDLTDGGATTLHSHAPDHAAVTLDANADTLLSLSTQALGLDTQAATYVFVGPTSGVAAVPTFRALAATDIPALAYEPADATIVKTGDADWIDLTDSGATTLHTHALADHAAQHGVSSSDAVFPADPGADKFLMWDDNPGALVWADAGGGTGDVIGPATNTANFIPQWNGANSKTLKDGLELVTTVDATGSDVKLASEQAIREALTALGTADGWIAATGTWTPRSQAYTNDPAAGANISLSMTDTSGFGVGDVVKVSSSAGVENALITVVTANTSITVAALYLDHTTTSPVVSLASTLYVERAYTNDPASGANIELNMADTTGFAVGDLVEVSSSAGRENATVTVVHANTHLTVNTLALNHTTTAPMVKQVVQNTFIVDTSADYSSTLAVGQRIKFTDSTVKYFILVAIATTRLTLYGGTDYSVVSTAAVTSPSYSMVKAPYGFPISPIKWTVEVVDKNAFTQATPTANIWYNPGTIKISIPIGVWNLIYLAAGYVTDAGSLITVDVFLTLSTANNTESDVTMTARNYLRSEHEPAGNLSVFLSANRSRYLDNTSRVYYYLNISTSLSNIDSIAIRGLIEGSTNIRAVCAYL
jgi:hypothetical protein